ncbi:MAG TPA: LLM class F420-dependent oxidoreductase [bacterium]|nr:LLM class F420-dependent oxidoreductase [bacterium]
MTVTSAIGPIGIWTAQLDTQPSRLAQAAVRDLETLGYGAVWFPESFGREAFTNAGLLLAGSRRIVAATGIASLYARDAVAMANGQRTLCEAYPERFLLGIGVSHAPAVEQMRGHRYDSPVAAMRAYLDAMDRAPFRAVAPRTAPERVLAALGPRMLALSAERSGGAHTYFVPPEHTARAREILGPGRLLAVEQAVVLERDAAKAREIARTHTSGYLKLINYTSNLRRLGFDEADLAGGGSDRLVDAIVGWGALDAVVGRVRAHQAAGADHVCIQVLTADRQVLPTAAWRELAGALLPASAA